MSSRFSDGGAEAINLLFEKTGRVAHGFRSFVNYRVRIFLPPAEPVRGDDTGLVGGVVI